jgi:hypothetical protein
VGHLVEAQGVVEDEVLWVEEREGARYSDRYSRHSIGAF